MNLYRAALYVAVALCSSSCGLLLDPNAFSVTDAAPPEAVPPDAAPPRVAPDAAPPDAVPPDAMPVPCADDPAYAAGPAESPSTYRRIDLIMNWEEAKATCEAAGAHLVIVETEAEADHLAQLTLSFNTWIGLSDAETEGTFLWIDGSPQIIERWRSGEPTKGIDHQDYVEVVSDGTWTDTDLDGGGNNRPLCECPSSL